MGECLFISKTSLLFIVSLICSLASEDIKQKERKKESECFQIGVELE